MEYGCPVFHDSLPNYLCEDLEKLQKRALHIIFPTLPYAEALVEAGVDSLFNEGGGGKGGVSSRNHEDNFSISRVTKNKISFSRVLEAQKRNKV